MGQWLDVPGDDLCSRVMENEVADQGQHQDLYSSALVTS